MRVALYARHSDEKQCQSTKSQIIALKAWCRREGWLIVDIFCDEAISGASMANRQGIQDLIEALVYFDIEQVICEDLSRISRDIEDITSFYKKTQFLDIPIETMVEGPIDLMHIGLKGTMNALYLKDLAVKTRRGMITAVLQGSVPGGRAYGYDLVKKLNRNGEPIRGLRKINQEEAQIINWIHQSYLDGKTLKEICNKLNSQAIPSPKGKKWQASCLVGSAERKTGILRQTLYKGILTFNKMHYKRHPKTGKRLSTVRPEGEWIRVPLHELAIMDEKLFDQVQAQLNSRSSIRKELKIKRSLQTKAERSQELLEINKKRLARQLKERGYDLQILSRKLHCSDHDLSITSIRTGIYQCSNKDCLNRKMKRPSLVLQTIKALKNLHVTEIFQFIKHNITEIKRLKKERNKLKKGLEKNRKAIRDIIDFFSKNGPSDEVLNGLKHKENECRKMVYDIEQIVKKINTLKTFSEVDPEAVRQQYLRVVRQYQNDISNHILLEALYSFIVRINISTKRDRITGGAKRSVKIDFDVEKILEKLIPC